MLRKLLIGVLVLTGCPQPGSGGVGGGSGEGGGENGAGGGTGGGGPAYAQSAMANVRFKRSVRLTNDFSAALGIPATALCKELGQYDCTTIVHPLALGGTDPYGIGLYEPLPFTGLASPIATERVALTACLNRVDLDLVNGGADALIFKQVGPDANGKLTDVEAPAVKEAIDTLYRRAVLRHATDAEVGHLKQLYKDIEASGKPGPAKAWMTLSCFAVLTTVEALFY